jgi:hypothetical protein
MRLKLNMPLSSCLFGMNRAVYVTSARLHSSPNSGGNTYIRVLTFGAKLGIAAWSARARSVPIADIRRLLIVTTLG